MKIFMKSICCVMLILVMLSNLPLEAQEPITVPESEAKKSVKVDTPAPELFSLRYNFGFYFPVLWLDRYSKDDKTPNDTRLDGKGSGIHQIEAGLFGFSAGYGFTYNPEKEEGSYRNIYFQKSGKILKADVNVELFYQRYKGFEIQNDAGYRTPDNKYYTYRSDITYQNFAMNFYVGRNSKNFKIDSALKQTDRQTSSGFGLFALVSPSYTQFKGNFSLIPDAYKDTFGKESGIKKGTFGAVDFSLGGGGTIVMGRLFMTGILFFGLGPAGYSYTTDHSTQDGVTIALKGDLKMSMGLSWDNVVVGASWTLDGCDYFLKSSSLESTSQYVEFFTGVRF
jgi:hypothetical protein